jgi:hypothetical protein
MSNVVPVQVTQEFLDSLDPTESVLLVRPYGFDQETETERTEELAVFSATEGLGTKSQAFLVYGIPHSGRYSFFDLNNLPQGYVVDLVMSSTSGQVLSRNHWEGNTGNQPQPLND